MSEPNALLQEGLQLLAETLQGGPARRLRSAGAFSPKLGGPAALAALFAPVSPDPQVAAVFQERHLAGMRAEVFAAVSRALERWGQPWDEQSDQSRFDDLFVAMAHLRLMVRPRRAEPRIAPLAARIAEITLAVQDELTGRWFQPLIRDKLNSDTPGTPVDPTFSESVRRALGG